MIAPRDAGSVLDMLSAAFPTHPMPPASVELFVGLCTTPPFVELSVLTAAAAEWIRTHDWFPTVHQLTDAYQAEARRRIADRQSAEQQRAIAAGMLPGVSLDPGYAVEMVDVMRTALATVGARPHVHPRGDSSRCPTCSRKDEIAEQVAAEAHRLVVDRGLRPPQAVETYACLDCSDRGFVVVDDETMTTRPCGKCNGAAYERWIAGHLAPGHDCAECRDVRRGR